VISIVAPAQIHTFGLLANAIFQDVSLPTLRKQLIVAASKHYHSYQGRTAASLCLLFTWLWNV